MEYPLIIGGVQRGTAKIISEGLYTLVSAETEHTYAQGITRLWLCGAEGSFYLGVMEPVKGKLSLRKRYTRRDTLGFPKLIDCVRDEAVQCPHSDAADEPADRIWYAAADGSLSSRDGDGLLIALPSSIGRAVRGADIRIIGGREYMIFRY